MASRQDKDKGVNVQVLLRCRPFSDDEVRSNAPQVLTCNEYQREVSVTQNIAGKQIDRVFTFDKVFGPAAQQKDLYHQAVVPIVNEVLEGFNCTIFAYGQTGTGKTYTMEGECRKSKSGPKGQLPSDAGVIPRAVKQIFDTLESQNAEYSVKVTFIELYNEEITDLLAPEELSKALLEEKMKKPLLLMEDGKGGVLVRGIEEEIVTNASEIFSLLERGSAKRRTAETLLNKQSSRSHSLFTITIHIKEATPEGEELIKCGKLNLVDLAGSENISRSGAREGRAREAGEINKSLLTLGRVITALVEHNGHIPYRDSKLTRLLRDSLGGRTKTCIIATVSPSVYCLEETLSTLDYAHRAKNIKNKPEVNQKMMKTTLIKDLYGEIDRLKAEVYAAREKNGVYIPKERYYQEESERKAMAEQIEQMTSQIETNIKQFEELQQKYDSEVQRAADLTNRLDFTQLNLVETSKLLHSANETIKKSEYALKEKEFIISEQKRAENALMQQACSLHSDLEKSLHDNAGLHVKLGKEDQLHSANKSVLNTFYEDLVKRIGLLCKTVAGSVTEQSERLKSVESLCNSSLDFYNKSIEELKDKMATSRSMYLSHVEAIENIVRLHKSNSDASLEEILDLESSHSRSVEELLVTEEIETDQIFKNLHDALNNHQREMAAFAHDLRERIEADKAHVNEVAKYIVGVLEKLIEETQKLQDHVDEAHTIQMESIGDFGKVYEEHSKFEGEKLLADITNLLSNHLSRQKELVDKKVVDLKLAANENNAYLVEHIKTVKGVTTDAKRKWHTFSGQAEHKYEDSSLFSAAKHCRMEVLLQECIGIADAAHKQCKKVNNAVNELETKQLAAMESLAKSAMDSNDQHNVEISGARETTERDIASNCDDILRHFDGILEHECESIAGMREAVESHLNTIQNMQDDHGSQAAEIEKQAKETVHHRYVDYEPSGNTPVRCELEIPSKKSIESLRSMPMEDLSEEFRENNPFIHGSNIKDVKSSPSLIPRLPLAHIN